MDNDNNESGFCEEICFYRFEGHCNGSKYEFYTHCEKLFWNNQKQRGYPKEINESKS